MENKDLKQQNVKLKTLKIYKKYFKRLGYFVILPEIRLNGKWVEKLGFSCGSIINIQTEKNRIVITSSEKIIIVL